jgi:tripartite-type tricarboxylate transporter receptor subunit TctC
MERHCAAISVFRLCLLALLAAVALPVPDAAAAYPDRPIEIINAFSPGGASDLAARLMAGYVSKKWGQPVNVINVTGGAGIIGTRQALAAKPDGYTLFCDSHTAPMMGATQTDLPFQWDHRTFVARVTLDPVIFSVKQDAAWKDLREFAEQVRKQPKTLRYGMVGLGVSTFAVPEFLEVAGLTLETINRVSFKGGGEVVTALAGGHIDLAAQQYSESSGLLIGKRIRGLAVVSEKRLPGLPDLPTAKEAGFPTLSIGGWQGISGPAGLPKEIVEKWSTTLGGASTDPAFHEQAAKVYKAIGFLGAKEFAEFVQADYKRYLGLATKLGLR